MRPGAIALRRLRRLIGLVGLCLALVAMGSPAEATPEGRACEAEPTDETIHHGDLITCAIAPADDTDIFRFAGAPGEAVVIQATATSGGGFFLPCIELFAPDGKLIAGQCASSVNRLDVILSQAGTHAIVIRSGGNARTGTYNLALERTFPLTRLGTPIRYGQTLAGQALDPSGDLDLFVFTGASGNTIGLQTTATSGDGAFRPCLELYGPDGRLIPPAICTGAQNRTEVTLSENGTHTLLVRSGGSVTTGTYTVVLQCLVGACADAAPTSLDAAVSPPKLSVPVGTPAIAFATVSNTGPADAAAEGDQAADPGDPDALACTVVQLTGPPLPFFSQPVDPVTLEPIGPPNTPVNIPPGESATFMISLTPTTPLCPTQFTFGASCSNADFADTITGINTLLLTAGSPASCGLSLTAAVSQPTFAVGQTLVLGGSATNSGIPGTAADFYVGILRPDNSIHFLTSTGVVAGNVADIASFRPLAVNVPLSTPFSVTEPAVFTLQRTAGDLPGPYVFFVGAVRTGALAGGTIPSDQILGLATAPYSFP